MRVAAPQCFVWQFQRRDGAPLDLLVQMDVASHRPDCVTLRLQDLSSLQRADRALEATEARLRQVLDNTTAVVFIKDDNGRYSYVNDRFCEMVGRTQSELIGGYDSDVFPPEVVARLRADDRRVMELGAPQEIEEHLIVDGRTSTYLATKFPLTDAQGRPYAVCGIATDITRRKRGEEALRGAALAVSTAEGPALYQELTRYLATTLGVECCFIAECTTTASTHVRTLAVYTDRGYEENIEYALPGTVCGTVVGRNFRLVPEGVRRLYPEDPMFKRLAIESYAAYPLNDSHGCALGLIAVMSQRALADRELVESMLQIFATRAAAEIERSRAEEARRVSEESYRAIFEAAEDAIFVHDWDSGRIVDANPKACEHYGYGCEEIKGIRIGDISSGVYPYVEEEALRLINEAKQGKPLRFEWHRKSRDGTPALGRGVPEVGGDRGREAGAGLHPRDHRAQARGGRVAPRRSGGVGGRRRSGVRRAGAGARHHPGRRDRVRRAAGRRPASRCCACWRSIPAGAWSGTSSTRSAARRAKP